MSRICVRSGTIGPCKRSSGCGGAVAVDVRGLAGQDGEPTILGFLAETGVCVSHEFREGNVPCHSFLDPNWKTKTIATIRWQLTAVAGRLIRHGRRLVLRLAVSREKFALLLQMRLRIAAFS